MLHTNRFKKYFEKLFNFKYKEDTVVDITEQKLIQSANTFDFLPYKKFVKTK